MRYVLYKMAAEPNDDNSPVAMNDILGIGEYSSPKNAMRYLRPRSLKEARCFNGSMPALWLGLYTMPQLGPMKLALKERL